MNNSINKISSFVKQTFTTAFPGKVRHTLDGECMDLWITEPSGKEYRAQFCALGSEWWLQTSEQSIQFADDKRTIENVVKAIDADLVHRATVYLKSLSHDEALEVIYSDDPLNLLHYGGLRGKV
tara:strand:+ start:318 stop:689 length:372 start_codon:yes stop_codon:yes gene_type:complete